METPVFGIKLNDASIITNFINEAMQHQVVREHISKKDEKTKEVYINTIRNIKIYEISGTSSKEVYFRLQDVARLVDVRKYSAAVRVATFDVHEAIQGNFGGGSKPLWFLSEPGIIKFMFQSRGTIAKVFCRLFSNIIIQVSNNTEMFASMVRQTIEEDVGEILEFIDDVNVRLELIKEMYEEEKERNRQLEIQNSVYAEKTYRDECMLYSLKEENSNLEQTIDHVRYEMNLVKDDDLLNRMMQNYMSPVYVYLLDYDEAVKQFKGCDLIIPAQYAERYSFGKKYGLVNYHDLGFKITTVKSKNKDQYMVNVHYVHGLEMFARLGESFDELISIEKKIHKTAIYAYGPYDLIGHLLEEYKSKFPEKKPAV